MPRPPTSSPPPANFPFMTGSFDYPHASTPPHNDSQSSTRNVLRLADEPPERSSTDLPELGYSLQEVRRRTARRRQLHRLLGPPSGNDGTVLNLLRRPPTANLNRPRATPSERYLQRAQARIDQERDAIMNSAMEPFDSLSERPPIIASFEDWIAMVNRRSSPGAPDTVPRRTKRRKLDHKTDANPELQGYKYGYRGQVVPGRLRMEIVSCDGGQIMRDNPMGDYDVENVLKNDKSVYCTESSKCNILLKHIGDAPFALEKVIVRAPDRGYTSPVQEGLIFVAMSADELLCGTSAYRLQYHRHSPSASPSPRRSGVASSGEQISPREAIGSVNHDSRTRVHPDHQESSGSLVESDEEIDFDNCDYTTAAGISAPTPPPFIVTTTSEEEEEEEEEASSLDDCPNIETMTDRIQREGRWRPSSDDEDADVVSRQGTGARFRQLLETAQFADDYEIRSRRIIAGSQYRNPGNTESTRASRLERPSRIYDGAENAGRGNVLAPHARFFIKKNKSKITIKFEPAISGRNVLLKLWSPKDSEDGNIDIESVQFYGYSGPRFFQATQAC